MARVGFHTDTMLPVLAVVETKEATSILKDGQKVVVGGIEGQLRIQRRGVIAYVLELRLRKDGRGQGT